MMLFHVPGGTSTLSLPAIVTFPGFTGCRYWRWLPRVVMRRQPSRSTARIASRTLGIGREACPAAHGRTRVPRYGLVHNHFSTPKPSDIRFFSIAASSRRASPCCSRHCAASRAIFSSNGSPSSSGGFMPT